VPKVQGQEPALEETRNSEVTVYFSFILLLKKSGSTIVLSFLFTPSALASLRLP
jgi:hypothetical protein